MMSRTQVAEHLQLSEAGVRMLERKGELHPKHQSDGTYAYDEQEVAELKSERARTAKLAGRGADGTTAAKVFAQLDAGVALTAIVAKEQLPPAMVRELAEAWREMKELDLSVPSVPRRIRRLKGQVARLEARLEQLVTAVDKWGAYLNALPVGPVEPCAACGDVPANVKVACSGCGTAREMS